METLKSLLLSTPSEGLLAQILNKAVYSGRPEVFQHLVSLGATHDTHTAGNAIIGDNLDTLKRLLDNGLPTKYVGGHVDSPLEIAASVD